MVLVFGLPRARLDLVYPHYPHYLPSPSMPAGAVAIVLLLHCHAHIYLPRAFLHIQPGSVIPPTLPDWFLPTATQFFCYTFTGDPTPTAFL